MSWTSRGRALVIVVATALVFTVDALTFDADSAGATAPRVVGDYETGNFDQWAVCQNIVANTRCDEFRTETYAMRVQSDVVRQGRFAARFELRPGDQPEGICCGERAEVSGQGITNAVEGDEVWYQWSTRFGAGFPARAGWSVLAQWHANAPGSPPVAFSAGATNVSPGRWGLVLSTWEAPGVAGPTFTPWSAPVVPGAWNDIKARIRWSARDDAGFIELWVNGAPQTFTAQPCAGETRCRVRTLMPGGGGVYYKQGYYRDPRINETGVVYHDGFSMADDEGSLVPL